MHDAESVGAAVRTVSGASGLCEQRTNGSQRREDHLPQGEIIDDGNSSSRQPRVSEVRSRMVNVPRALLLAEGPPPVRQPSPLPPAREFLLSAGFGGAAALLAALLIVLTVAFAVWRASKRDQRSLTQRESHDAQLRDDALHTAAVVRCERRFAWVVETAGIEPASSEGATLGLGPELALEILKGLHRDAKQLGDDTLVRGIAVYFNQLSLVLAQQGGPLEHLDATAPANAADDDELGAAAPQAAHRAAGSQTSAPTRTGSEETPGVEETQPAPGAPKTNSSTPPARAVNVAGRRRRR